MTTPLPGEEPVPDTTPEPVGDREIYFDSAGYGPQVGSDAATVPTAEAVEDLLASLAGRGDELAEVLMVPEWKVDQLRRFGAIGASGKMIDPDAVRTWLPRGRQAG